MFQMLHYEPQLANYNARPAVHWFSFPDLCRLGREAGFAQFYSPLDLIDDRARLSVTAGYGASCSIGCATARGCVRSRLHSRAAPSSCTSARRRRGSGAEGQRGCGPGYPEFCASSV